MRRHLRFATLTSWVLLTRAYDAHATAAYTPDLSHEANPLVSVLGLGWGPLLVIYVSLCAWVVYTIWVSTYRTFDLLPSEAGLDRGDFAAQVYLGRPGHWPEVFYKLPDSLERLNHYAGHLLAPCLAFAGVVSTAMWLGLNHVPAYRAWHSATVIYGVLVAGCAAILLRWHQAHYAVYQRRTGLG